MKTTVLAPSNIVKWMFIPIFSLFGAVIFNRITYEEAFLHVIKLKWNIILHASESQITDSSLLYSTLHMISN